MPLSLAISTIASVLIGWFFSLVAVQILLLASALAFVATLATECRRLSHQGKKLLIGWKPFGGMAITLAVAWIGLALLSLVDFESHQRLFMSLTVYDHAARTNWTESIIRTGIPPANPLYWYRQSASMRYYYFWLVDCAAVAKLSHLPPPHCPHSGLRLGGARLVGVDGALAQTLPSGWRSPSGTILDRRFAFFRGWPHHLPPILEHALHARSAAR